MALWQEIQRDTGEDLEMKVCGGLMLAENERDIEFLKGKIALEKSRGIEAELIGANELRALEPCIGDVAIAAEWCPGEGKINPLKGTYAVVAKAKAMGARFRRGSNVAAIERDGTHWKVTTSRGEIRARRVVNTAGPWAARGRPHGGRRHSRARRAAADGRHRAHGAHAVAPRRLRRSSSHPEADGLGRLHDRRRLDGGPRRAAQAVARPARQCRGQPVDRQPRAVPALADLHAIRIWAGMNVNIDRAPILGEVPGLPGFYNCVSSNGYTLAPVLARLTAEMLAGRSTSLPVAPFLLSRFG